MVFLWFSYGFPMVNYNLLVELTVVPPMALDVSLESRSHRGGRVSGGFMGASIFSRKH